MIRTLNLTFYTAMGALVLAVAGLVAGARPDDPQRLLAAGAKLLGHLAQSNPTISLVCLGVAAAVLVLPGLLMSGAGGGPKDPRRLFPVPERKAAFERAGNRCEYDGFLWFRCPHPAHHADHFYPHTRGGATSMRNLVAACSSCNLSKSAHMPTPWVKWRLERRRRRYFPAGMDTTAGEWFGR